ncbi:hypothetical protein K4F52_009659 [Lecanicillium sp. MT-2017a]|nr:hypothetical protein K4F52_009659 [Lecanicillium sp. MT-2017a]
MSVASLAARRRVNRSSESFRLTLLCVLISLFTLAWYSSGPGAGPDSNTARDRDTMTQPHLDASAAHDASANADAQRGLRNQANPADIATDSSLAMEIAAKRHQMPLRLISYNVRYATTWQVGGEQPWRIRGPKLCTQLDFITAGHENAFVCLQECLYSQIKDIGAQLGQSWAYIGRGRDKKETDGEFSPIFYRPDVWKCTHSETRWLSPTWDKPSRGWDAAMNRIVTIGEFTHRVTGTKVVVMSTHFDHIGVEARKNSAKLLIKFAKEWESKNDLAAVLIGGDFNSTPDDGAYQLMVAEGSGMSDISDLVPAERRYGNHLTYTSFGEPNEWPQRIDFLFIQEPRTARVNTFGVLANSFDDNIRISDHRPVVADMDIRA